jgi:hypothetical protein
MAAGSIVHTKNNTPRRKKETCMSVNYYEVSPLAEIVPLASELEQISLIESIRTAGQETPALIWRGKIVDGRCRQIACRALGIPLKVDVLDDTLPEDVVREKVISTNIRRNLTIAQKAIWMYRAYMSEKSDVEKSDAITALGKKLGVHLKAFYAVRDIQQHNSAYVDILYRGESVSIYDISGRRSIKTNSVYKLSRIIRSNNQIELSSELKRSSDAIPNTTHEWVKNTKKRLVRNDKECTAFLLNVAQTSKKLEEYKVLVEELKTEIEQLKQRSS